MTDEIANAGPSPGRRLAGRIGLMMVVLAAAVASAFLVTVAIGFVVSALS